MSMEQENERVRKVCDLLYSASKSIRILSHVSWSARVREQFFASDAKELPIVSYPSYDPGPPVQIVAEARKYIRTSVVDAWLTRQADILEKSARMLAACGSEDFYRYAGELYGRPADVLPDESSTSLALAKQFDQAMSSFAALDLGAPSPACHLASHVAEVMQTASVEMFGDDAPEVQIVDELSANALAGPRRIRIRRAACFSDKDLRQLVHHEAYVHVATSLNGLAQKDLRILAAGHPGTTKTQEGLAVFAEFITGSIDIDRMRRLSDRILAIQMSIDGADFLQVYRFFLERVGTREQAYENARRVFRGGVLTGGAPFTKDIVYLDGLIRVHNFLRVIVSTGKAACLRLLFCGKLDIEDVPVLHELTERGLCRPPKFLPPWASDLRFLLCYLSYSSFLNSVNLTEIKAHYRDILEGIPQSQS